MTKLTREQLISRLRHIEEACKDIRPALNLDSLPEDQSRIFNDIEIASDLFDSEPEKHWSKKYIGKDECLFAVAKEIESDHPNFQTTDFLAINFPFWTGTDDGLNIEVCYDRGEFDVQISIYEPLIDSKSGEVIDSTDKHLAHFTICRNRFKYVVSRMLDNRYKTYDDWDNRGRADECLM